LSAAAADDEAPWRRMASAYAESWLAMFGLGLLVICLGLALAAPWISPQNPYALAQLDIMDSSLPPGSEASAGFRFLLGSDDQGRDMVSAILYGLRISVAVGAAATGIALVVGLAFGLIAAYAGGRIDGAIMRIVDIQLSFPAILIALILIAVLGNGIGKIIFALVTVQWAYYARTVRASAMVERRKDYVEAARGLGLSSWRILFRHMLPNCLAPVIVIATVQMAHAIALEATLSFLGLGLPVTEPSLGLLISNGFQYVLSGKYWISMFPGVALLVTIVAINLVGDRLREVLNPRGPQ